MRIADNLIYPATTLYGLKNTGAIQRRPQAEDSYRQQSGSAQIIDAEYVDLNRTYKAADKSTLRSERRAEIAFDMRQETDNGQATLQQGIPYRKYSAAAKDLPPPGTYLNLYA